MNMLQPMSSSSNGTSFPCKSKVEGKIVIHSTSFLASQPKHKKAIPEFKP